MVIESVQPQNKRGPMEANEDSSSDPNVGDYKSSIISEKTRRNVASFVEDTLKYSMWTINPTTREHELDPGPLAIDFYCNNCKQSLPIGTVRIRCAECTDYDLCVPCACGGCYTDSHLPSHNYIPIGPNIFDLFSDGWSADEEILLLEGISKYGFGNWKQVSEMVNRVAMKTKSANDCEAHYNDVYICSRTSPYPDIRNLKTQVTDNIAKNELNELVMFLVDTHMSSIQSDDDGKIIPSEQRASHSDYIPPPVNILACTGERLKFFQSLNGYNIFRDELENEYLNDAELVIKDVEFEPWDTPAEIDFKIQLVDIYNGFLDERIYRKRLLIHRFWYNFLERDEVMSNMTEAEKLCYWRMSPLLKYQTEEEYINMTKLLVAKAEIEKRLQIVQRWNSLGLETLEDVKEFDALKVASKPNFKRSIPIEGEFCSNIDMLNLDENDTKGLKSYMDEISNKFCKDLGMQKAQFAQLMEKIANMECGGVVDSNVVPTWDVCIKDIKQEFLEYNSNLPKVTLGKQQEIEPCARIILKPNFDSYDLSDLKFDERLQLSDDKNRQQSGDVHEINAVVSQSNVIEGKQCLAYTSKFSLYKAKVEKNINKRKRDVFLTSAQKNKAFQRKF